ncbi:MAG: nucleotide sugar dehydrogenase, partial [Elusimicrobiota bacterium]
MTRVVVVGAGKMGLPLAAAFASSGCRVTACDTNPEVVRSINEGRCSMEEPGLPELIETAARRGLLDATSSTAEAVKTADVVVVIVPVVLTPEREADLSRMEAATREVAKGLKQGAMVCFETTLPVGTTRRVLTPILESGGLKAGKDFDVVFSPERVKSGSVLSQLKRNPKVVGGLTPQATERAARFYSETLGCPVSCMESAEAAELTKLAGMLYRDVNIALANELAAYAAREGVDFGPVLEAANTDGESGLLLPGIGVGGHCTPIYPYFLTRAARRQGLRMSLAEDARRANDEAPARALARVEAHWGPLKGRRVLILGLAFRPQVKEQICSPAYLLRDEAARLGAEVLVHDSLYTDEEIKALGFTPSPLECNPTAEVVVLNTAHRAFENLDFSKLAGQGVKVIVDGRNLWTAEAVRKAGLAYFGIGRPAKAGKAKRAAAPIPVCRPSFGPEEEEAVRRVVSS